MPLLGDILSKKSEKDKPLPVAHFTERHLVHPKATWEEAARLLQESFPRETRPEKPASWYAHLVETHWPGRVLPGNGPFYVPEWVFGDGDFEEREEVLKEKGFKSTVTHVVYLPHDGEYLAAIMRAAEDEPWNANPITYRGYIYPGLKVKHSELRPYNVQRWRL